MIDCIGLMMMGSVWRLMRGLLQRRQQIVVEEWRQWWRIDRGLYFAGMLCAPVGGKRVRLIGTDEWFDGCAVDIVVQGVLTGWC